MRLRICLALLLFQLALTQTDTTLGVTVDGELLAVLEAVAARYEAANPHTVDGKRISVKVELTEAPADPRERKLSYALALETDQATSDVYVLDAVLAGELAVYFADLNALGFAKDAEQHFSAAVQAARLGDNLVAYPWLMDAGLLYYRSDLLEKYGLEVPETWDELSRTAEMIQAGEQAGEPAFAGYLWQGALHEPLASNALEWLTSEGAGTVLEAQTITVNNAAAARALSRAEGWLGTVSPPDVLTHSAADSFNVWSAGGAAFMRNTYDFELSRDPDTRLAPLPAGQAGTSATLHSQHLAITKNSKQPNIAAHFVAFASSAAEQKTTALTQRRLPTRPELYKDIELTLVLPDLGALALGFSAAVPPPAAAAGGEYERAARLFARAAHNVLTGEVTPQAGLGLLELDLIDLTGFATE